MPHESKSLWGKPPKRIRGAYDYYDHSPSGEFNPKDAGSTFAAGIHQIMIFPAAAGFEYYAAQAYEMPPGMAFTTAWFAQIIVAVAFKIIANVLRNYGSSLIRDFGTWLWAWAVAIVRHRIFMSLFGWLPWVKKKAPKPSIPLPYPPSPYNPYPPAPRPGPIRRFLRRLVG